jgi:hypothetical protein
MGSSTDATKRSKFERLLIKSIGICVFGGAFFGASTWTLWMIVEGSDVSRILYLPLVVFAAIIPTTLIIGIICGIIAACLARFLGGTSFVSNPMTIWCRVGAEAGLILSVICLTLFIRIGENQNPLLWFSVFGIAGIGCGFLVGRSAWYEFRN